MNVLISMFALLLAAIRRYVLSIYRVPESHSGRANLRVLIMGAGGGIGLACARAFAGFGADLLLSDSDGAALSHAARELEARGLFCDVASEASVAIFAAEVQSSFSPLDVLINAAGRSYVRTLGTMRITRALLPMMRRDGGRKDIVNIAHMNAVADHHPFPYAASTKAFASLSDALAENIRGTKVVLTTILPREMDGAFGSRIDDSPAHPRNVSALRRFHCEISNVDAFATKIVAAVHAPRSRRRIKASVRTATVAVEMRPTKKCQC